MAFVGTLRPRNIPQRLEFLERFKQRCPLIIKQGAYEPVFNRSRIVLNQTAAQELNFRCFEAMACGAALLTEAGPHGLEDLFRPGEHLLPPYRPGDDAQAAAIATAWLDDERALAAVAATGAALVRENHLASHRAAQVSVRLAGLVGQAAHETRLDRIRDRQALLATAYAILADELRGEPFRDHQGLYLKAFLRLADQT